jgi:NAD(P) transhydrogenase subunit alpha
MNPTLWTEIYVFVLAVFVGFEVISKVPVVLHTPLMSGSNAIHGIVVVGGIVVLGTAASPLELWLGIVAVAFGAMNLAGGFVVTDRMLEMFRSKPKTATPVKTPGAGGKA